MNGLVAVRLIERGREVDVRHFDPPQEDTELHLQVWPEASTWYSLVAEDAAGKFLVSNPLWVTLEP